MADETEETTDEVTEPAEAEASDARAGGRD